MWYSTPWVKNGLFLAAGAIIFKTGWTRTREMDGLGRVMPVMLGCYHPGFPGPDRDSPGQRFCKQMVSCHRALASGTGVWSWLGPIILLISALLTAGYLLPLAIRGFFPGAGFDEGEIRSRGLGGQELPGL